MIETNIWYKNSENIKIIAKVVKVYNTNCVVIMTHDMNSNTEEDSLFIELAYKLSLNHCHGLCFDYRGHGESTGS